ncbi:MAG: hypothetical protein WC263_05250 [Candidatus Micrarchaeia archaeon]|jgi:hypothetical protein
MSKLPKKPDNPFNWRIYAIALLALLTLNNIHQPFDNKKAFEKGVRVGRQHAIDSINKADSIYKARPRSTFSLPIPLQLRNQASTAKPPSASAKQAINR